MRKKVILAAAALLAAGAIALAWRQFAGWGGQARPTELVLYCAAGMRPGAAALIDAYQANHSVRVVATYEGSGKSLGKIAAGSGGDLFMPGAEFYVDQAVAKGLADAATKRTVAYFVPVILVAKDNPKGVHELADLKRGGLRVGLGDERSAAVGQISLEIFRKNNIPLDAVMKNVVYKSGTVDELGVAVQMGTVDAVIVWDVCARLFANAARAIPIPPEQNVVTTIPITVLRSSRHAQEAKQFIDFVTSPEGRKILKSQGFSVAPP